MHRFHFLGFVAALQARSQALKFGEALVYKIESNLSISFLVPMLTASGTYAVLLACVCMYVCVCVCMYVWTCKGIATGDVNKSIPRPRLPKQ